MLVGLGNPGEEYEGTRHNAGAMAVRRWVGCNAVWLHKPAWKCEVAEVSMGDTKVLAVQPLVYMNDSGVAARLVRDYYDMPLNRIVVAHDDMEVQAGEIFFSKGGSSKGHKGVKSIEKELGEKDFYRLRIGIGRPPENYLPKDFVLSKFNQEPDWEKTSQAIQGLLEQLTLIH